jgi:hypothetical protein
MKKWIFAVALCGSFGCAIQEPGQPMQFAPGAPAESEAKDEAAPSEAPAEPEAKTEERSRRESENALEAGGAAPADSAADDLDDSATRDRAPKTSARRAPAPARAAKLKDVAATCDSACKKACVGAADLDICAQAYAAGCFSGTAPATFDCGGNGVKGKAKTDGVEERGLPVNIP